MLTDFPKRMHLPPCKTTVTVFLYYCKIDTNFGQFFTIHIPENANFSFHFTAVQNTGFENGPGLSEVDLCSRIWTSRNFNWTIQSNSCTNGSTTVQLKVANHSDFRQFLSEMLVFEHILKCKLPPQVQPKQDPSPRMPLSTRTQLERGDKRGMQGPWLSVISMKGGERAIKGENGDGKSPNWRPIAFISSECNPHLYISSPLQLIASLPLVFALQERHGSV